MILGPYFSSANFFLRALVGGRRLVCPFNELFHSYEPIEFAHDDEIKRLHYCALFSVSSLRGVPISIGMTRQSRLCRNHTKEAGFDLLTQRHTEPAIVPNEAEGSKYDTKKDGSRIKSGMTDALLLLCQLLPESFILVQILDQPALAADVFGMEVLAAF